MLVSKPIQKWVNDHPEVQGVLYDLELLPETIQTLEDALRLQYMYIGWKVKESTENIGQVPKDLLN